MAGKNALAIDCGEESLMSLQPGSNRLLPVFSWLTAQTLLPANAFP
jgi:hypothetical protein